MRTRRNTLIRRFFIVAVVIGFAGILAVLIGYRGTGDTARPIPGGVSDGADISLGHFEHTATCENRCEWRLTADKATLNQGSHRLRLVRPNVTYYLTDGGRLTLSADVGTFHTESNDIEVSGHVVVHNDGYRLKTSRMVYHHKDNRLDTDRPVRVQGPWANLSADAMTIDIDSQTARFHGNVKGILRHVIQ